MGIQWNSGIMMLNNTEQFTIAPVTELSVTEEYDKTATIPFSACKTAEFSGTTDYINTDLLFANKPDSTRPFAMEFDAPILIQARWHKKWRTRKKWLKRYGMKKDTVHMTAIIESMENVPEEPPIGCEEGLIATFPSVAITCKEIGFIFNEYQMRKGMMMEVL